MRYRQNTSTEDYFFKNVLVCYFKQNKMLSYRRETALQGVL